MFVAVVDVFANTNDGGGASNCCFVAESCMAFSIGMILVRRDGTRNDIGDVGGDNEDDNDDMVAKMCLFDSGCS